MNRESSIVDAAILDAARHKVSVRQVDATREGTFLYAYRPVTVRTTAD